MHHVGMFVDQKSPQIKAASTSCRVRSIGHALALQRLWATICGMIEPKPEAYPEVFSRVPWWWDVMVKQHART